jgi:hypothetical protein
MINQFVTMPLTTEDSARGVTTWSIALNVLVHFVILFGGMRRYQAMPLGTKLARF